MHRSVFEQYLVPVCLYSLFGNFPGCCFPALPLGGQWSSAYGKPCNRYTALPLLCFYIFTFLQFYSFKTVCFYSKLPVLKPNLFPSPNTFFTACTKTIRQIKRSILLMIDAGRCLALRESVCPGIA